MSKPQWWGAGIEFTDPLFEGDEWRTWDGRDEQSAWDGDDVSPRIVRWRRTSDRPSHFTVLLTPEEADWLQELLRGTLVEPDEVMERKILGALEVATDPARALAE